MTGISVACSDVSKRYLLPSGETLVALERVGLEVNAGAAIAVTGPSGSGKSTLLHLIGAMDSADEGTITVGGSVVTALSRKEQPLYRRTIGFVFQRFHLLPALTALDNVAAPLLPRHKPAGYREHAQQLLAAVGLEGREAAIPAELSGGQQQRVAIARALINDPGLLLADEPTGNLDSRTGTDIMDLLVELSRNRGMTIMVATHDSVVAKRCDARIALYDGRVVEADGRIVEAEGLY